MKGRNTLHLNEATIIEAVQEYLNQRLKEPTQKVESVKFSGSGPYQNVFLVTLEEKKDDLPRDPIQHKLDREAFTGDRT